MIFVVNYQIYNLIVNFFYKYYINIYSIIRNKISLILLLFIWEWTIIIFFLKFPTWAKLIINSDFCKNLWKQSLTDHVTEYTFTCGTRNFNSITKSYISCNLTLFFYSFDNRILNSITHYFYLRKTNSNDTRNFNNISKSYFYIMALFFYIFDNRFSTVLRTTFIFVKQIFIILENNLN